MKYSRQFQLNPAPEDSKDGEELDDQQLQGVLMDFYYKLDTYDARDTPEHADLGDEAYELVKKEKSSESGGSNEEWEVHLRGEIKMIAVTKLLL